MTFYTRRQGATKVKKALKNSGLKKKAQKASKRKIGEFELRIHSTFASRNALMVAAFSIDGKPFVAAQRKPC